MSLLRPKGFDDLGLRRSAQDRLLPFVVGAMAFLGALAVAGAIAASGLAQHWQGAGASLTIQVPNPSGLAEGRSRVERVLTLLRGTPGVLMARTMPEDELSDLLRPWLGSGTGRIALPLPAVIEVRLQADQPAETLLGLIPRLAAAAPGTLLESTEEWVHRLSILARSVQACAALAVLMVGFVAVAVVAVAVRAGLSTRRDAVEIVHELGASDGYIAAQFANRALRLALTGAVAGSVLALPLLIGLVLLAAPFAATPDLGAGLAGLLPSALWLALPGLPVVAAVIGWVTAQVTVRRWLRRLV